MNYDLHHIGMVVRDISSCAERLRRGLNLQWDGKIIDDPVQTVRVSFLRHRQASAPMLELVEPMSETSRVTRFLKEGGGCHHVCYEVDEIADALLAIQRSGAIIVQHPVAAVAFDGRLIAWVYTRDHLLIEFLSRT